jgi:hypothetical protein
MIEQPSFPPSYDKKTTQALLEKADSIYRGNTSDRIILPLLIHNRASTNKALDIAGALYQNILSSVRLYQYHRALLYLAALNHFCLQHFTDDASKHAMQELTKQFLK